MSKTIGPCGITAIPSKDDTCLGNVVKCCQNQCGTDTGCGLACFNENIACCKNDCSNIGSCGKAAVHSKDATCGMNVLKCCTDQCGGDTDCGTKCFKENIVCCTSDCNTVQTYKENYTHRGFSGIGVL